jgi:hypothetical protein
VRLWPFGRKPKQEHYLGEYTEPSFRGAIFMLVLCVVIVAALWLVYSWALNQPGAPEPTGAVDRVVTALAGAGGQSVR